MGNKEQIRTELAKIDVNIDSSKLERTAHNEATAKTDKQELKQNYHTHRLTTANVNNNTHKINHDDNHIVPKSTLKENIQVNQIPLDKQVVKEITKPKESNNNKNSIKKEDNKKNSENLDISLDDIINDVINDGDNGKAKQKKEITTFKDNKKYESTENKKTESTNLMEKKIDQKVRKDNIKVKNNNATQK